MPDIKKIIKIPFRMLSSNVFLLWLAGGWIAYYVLSAIWMKEAFAGFAVGINKNPFIQIPYILFLISGYLNLIRVAGNIFRKSRLQFITWIILPAGVLLFLTGFFLSLYARQSGQRLIGEGDIIKPPWSSESYRITSIEPGLRDSLLDINAEQGIFAHEPKLTVLDKSSNSFEVGAFPPVKIKDTYFHILNFGIAPGIRLFENGNKKDDGYIPLRILAPNSSDYFEIPPLPYRFLVSMEPEKTFQKGGVRASQFNLKNPFYWIRVFKGDKIISEGPSQQGIQFDNYTLHFFDHTFWVLLEAVKDPAVPLLRLSILLIVIGIPLFLIRLVVSMRKLFF